MGIERGEKIRDFTPLVMYVHFKGGLDLVLLGWFGRMEMQFQMECR